MKRVKEWRCVQEQITDLAFNGTKRKMTMNTSLLFSPSVTCHFPSLNLICFSFLLCANKVCGLTYLVSSLLFSIITWFSFKESLSFNLRLYGLDGTKFTTRFRAKHMTQTHDLSLNNHSHRDQFRNGSLSWKHRSWYQHFLSNQWVSGIAFCWCP